MDVLPREISEQLEKRGSWLRVKRTPREQSVHADALTNVELAGCDPSRRVEVGPSDLSWVILPEMVEAGGGMAKELSEHKTKKKEERRAARQWKRQRKSREQALRVRDPW